LQDLLQNPTTEWSEIEERAAHFGMDLTQSTQMQMLYHYYFRNVDHLSLEQCAEMSQEEICRRSMVSLYAQRMKEWDQDSHARCDAIPEKIQHGEQPLLKEIFEDVVNRKCP
jgi:sugar diacid utilization regulator